MAAANSLPVEVVDPHDQYSCLTSNQTNEDDDKKEEEEEVDDGYLEICEKYKDIIPTLAKEKSWWVHHDDDDDDDTNHLVKYQGAWIDPPNLLRVMMVQQHYKPQPPASDILLATLPKSGTTWYKSLVFAVLNRTRFHLPSTKLQHPLLSNGPHDLVPILEQTKVAYNLHRSSHHHHLSLAAPKDEPVLLPRLFSTHIPYPLLPAACSTGCRIIYVFRNPKDLLTSSWHFFDKIRPKQLPPVSLERVFELFIKGVWPYGPYWDHVLGYWNAHLESPDKVLFLTYEETKKDPCACVKKLAEFMDRPFSLEEESAGGVQEILKLCSIENLRSLKVNKTGVFNYSDEYVIDNSSFFRKAEVGDWQNHLTPEMIECLDQITMEKFSTSAAAAALIHRVSMKL